MVIWQFILLSSFTDGRRPPNLLSAISKVEKGTKMEPLSFHLLVGQFLRNEEPSPLILAQNSEGQMQYEEELDNILH
jgi:hypothetical protein